MVRKKIGSWPSWSEDEIRLLKKLYKNTPAKKIAEQLGRTVGALRRRAWELGLHSKKYCHWSKKDLEILKKLHPTEKFIPQNFLCRFFITVGIVLVHFTQL